MGSVVLGGGCEAEAFYGLVDNHRYLRNVFFVCPHFRLVVVFAITIRRLFLLVSDDLPLSRPTLSVGDEEMFGSSFLREGNAFVLRPVDGGEDVRLEGFFDAGHDIVTPAGHRFGVDWLSDISKPSIPVDVSLSYTQSGGPTSIGTVATFEGQGFVLRSTGERVPLSKDLILNYGDSIETGADTSVVMEFLDKTKFNLGSETSFVLDEFVFDPGTKEGSWGVSIVKGSFSFVTGELKALASSDSPDIMFVRTPSATIGVRGTTVSGVVDSGTGGLTVTLLPDADETIEHKVVINNDVGSVILAEPFQTAIVNNIGAAIEGLFISSEQAVSLYGSVLVGDHFEYLEGTLETRSGPTETDGGPGDDVAPTEVGDLSDSVPSFEPLPEPQAAPDPDPVADPDPDPDPAPDPAPAPTPAPDPAPGSEPSNNAPTAADTTLTVAEDTTDHSGTLPAATDADGDAVTYAKATDPSHGSVTVNADGTYSYTPTGDYSGTDSFTYTVSDGQETNTYTVDITVTPVTDTPTVSVSDASGPEDTAIALSISGAATDSDGSETSSLSYTISGVPGGATLSAGEDNGDGSWTLTPAQLSGLTITPATDYSGEFDLTVTTRAQDGSGADVETAVDTITVTVEDNNAPTAADTTLTVAEDTTDHSGTLPAATDADGDAVTYAKATDPSHGSVTVDADGTYSYTPTGDYSGTDSFTYTVSDGQETNDLHR